MNHADHVALIRAGVEGTSDGPWADLGAGTGAFTLALADLLGPGRQLIAVDRAAADLREGERRVRAAFPGVDLRTLMADFTRPLDLEPLAGLVIANALHFVERREQLAVVRSLTAHLRPGGRFVVVEYDADRGNPWVPHPFSFRAWERLARDAGLIEVQQIGRVPSRFLSGIYGAFGRHPDRSPRPL